MPLDTLPTDVLCCIGSCLRIHELECLAQTFNSAITSVCLSLLKEWLSFAQNQRIMHQLFNEDKAYAKNWQFDKFCLAHMTDSKLLALSPPNARTLQHNIMEYLASKPDFRWLMEGSPIFPDAASTGEEKSIELSEPPASLEDMQILQDSLMRLGLNLPRGFTKFMTSPTLRRQMWHIYPEMLSYSNFVFRPRLHKVVSHKPLMMSNGDQDTINGYLIRFDAWIPFLWVTVFKYVDSGF
jgi:hypothetical protein